MPDAVGGSGREDILVASGSTPVDDDGRAAGVGEEPTPLLASEFDGRKQKGVARDATRKESAGGASGVGLGKKERKKVFFFSERICF